MKIIRGAYIILFVRCESKRIVFDDPRKDIMGKPAQILNPIAHR